MVDTAQGKAIQALSLVATLLQVPLLYFHSQQKNLAILVLTSWLLILNLNSFISTLLWARAADIDTWFSGVGYCDLMVYLVVMAHTGLVLAVLAVARNLSILVSESGPSVLFNSFRSRMIDLLICFGPSVVFTALFIVIQTNRYGIFLASGCNIFVSAAWPTIPIFIVPAPVFSLMACFYAYLALYRYLRRRRDFKDLLHTTNSGLDKSKFMRLLVFCLVITVVMLPLSLVVAVLNSLLIDIHLPYNWDEVHAEFQVTPRFPYILSVSDSWLYIFTGLIQFACFGTGRSLMTVYKLPFERFRRSSSQDLSTVTTATLVSSKSIDKDEPTTWSSLFQRKSSKSPLVEVHEMKWSSSPESMLTSEGSPAAKSPTGSAHDPAQFDYDMNIVFEQV